MFEAIVFVAGAVLFLLAVLYFVILWQDRVSLARRQVQLDTELASLKEQKIDLDIRERELRVWADGLEHQQRAIAKAEEELRMLTASKSELESLATTASGDPQRSSSSRRMSKNAKHATSEKL